MNQLTSKTMEKNVGFNIIDSKEWESVIEVLPHAECQKHLNQWRHEFDIMILYIGPANDNGFTYMSIMRKKRA